MDLDRLSLAVRPRTTWVAIDLGLLLSRAWRKAYFLPWLISVTVTWLLLNAVFFQYPFLAFLLFWWLKPLLDRPLLFVLGHATFGNKPSTADALSHWRTTWQSPWFSALTWRRLSPQRVLLLAVSDLEHADKEQRGKRLNALSQRLFTPLLLVTALFFVTEWLLLVPGALLFINAMMPFGLNTHVIDIMTEQQIILAVSAVYYLVVLFLEPYFVGCCFSLYLNNRTIIEGWDLRIIFKKAAARLQQLAPLLLLLLVPSTLAAAVPSPLAIATLSTAWQSDDAEGNADGVLLKTRQEVQDLVAKDENFNKTEERGRFVYRWQDEEDTSDIIDPTFAPPGLIGNLLTNTIIVAILIFVVLLIFLLIRAGAGSQLRAVGGATTPDVDLRQEAQSGFLVDSEQLPPRILDSAREAWREGLHRRALSLLFRGAIAFMIDGKMVDIAECSTEGEVLAEVKKQAPANMAGDFKVLTQTWINLAYGHKIPSDERFERICQDYDRHWQEAQP